MPSSLAKVASRELYFELIETLRQVADVSRESTLASAAARKVNSARLPLSSLRAAGKVYIHAISEQ